MRMTKITDSRYIHVSKLDFWNRFKLKVRLQAVKISRFEFSRTGDQRNTRETNTANESFWKCFEEGVR